jgi:tetratricopeptide (TPR) repeat protein
MPQRTYLYAGLLIAGLLLFFHPSAYADKTNKKEADKTEMKRLAHLGYNNLSVDPELSLEYFDQLENLASEKQDSVYWIYGLNHKALIYMWQLNYPAALRNLMKAKTIKPNDYYILLNLANTHRLSGNFKEALYNYEHLREVTSLNNRNHYLGQMALLYFDNGKKEKAFEFAEQAISLANNCEDSIRGFLNYGHIYLSLNEVELAGDYLKNTEKILSSCDNLYNSFFLKASLKNNLGHYFIKKEDYSKAEDYLFDAIEIAEKQKIYYVLEEAYIGMQKIAAHQNDHAKLELYQQKERDFNKIQKARLTEYFEELVKYKDEKSQAVARRLEKSESKISLLMTAALTITGLLIILLAAALIYHRMRVNKLNRQLIISESNRIAQEKQKLIYEARLATHRGEEDELPDEA